MTPRTFFKYFLILLFSSSLGQVDLANATSYECDANGVASPSLSDAFNYCVAPAGEAGGSAKNTENRIYSGFVWELFGDQGLVPEFVIGVRSLQVKSNDNVKGADASFRIKFQDKVSLDSLRLAYVGGERDVMGNVGVGYSFSHSSWLGTAAIQGPYTRLSADYMVSENKFKYFAELNTLDKPSKVMRVTRPLADGTCPSTLPIRPGAASPVYGYLLTPVVDGAIPDPFYYSGSGGPPTITVDPNQIVNGKTCYTNLAY